MGVEAVVVPLPLAVEALTVTGCELRVTNTGPLDDEYSFAMDREAAQWGWVTPSTVSVPAGGEGSVNVLFRLPKAPNPPAGPMPFTVAVTSVTDKAVSAVAKGVVEVAPIFDVLATLDPVATQGSGPSHRTVALSNRGNVPVRARLTAADPTGDLDFDIEPVTVEAAPGTSASANLRVTPRHTLRRGTAERPFQVVAQIEGHEPPRVDGKLTQEGIGYGRTAMVLGGVLAVLLVGGAALAVATVMGGDSSPSTATPPSAAPGTPGDLSGDDPACPARGHDNRDRRTTGALPFDYSFLFTTPDGCRPLRFNPCEPIHYIVNPADSPREGVEDVRQAFRLIAEAGGYTFVDEGLTDVDRFALDRAPYNPARYGERWAPIVVSWSRLGTTGRSEEGVAAMGNGHMVDGAIVTGMLNLDADARIDVARETPLPSGFGDGISWGRVMLHELGHVFGLGHVQSKSSIMYEPLVEQTLVGTEFGVGDIQGWRLLGRQAGCAQTPPPRPVPPLGAGAVRAGTTTVAP